MVNRARREWGITPFVADGKWIALRPSRGSLVHAALSAKADRTLCTTPTTWKGGAQQTDRADLNCLWCMTRIQSFGSAS